MTTHIAPIPDGKPPRSRGIGHQLREHEECVGEHQRHPVQRRLAELLPHHTAPLAVHQQQEELHEVEAVAEEALVLVVVVSVLADLGVVVVVVAVAVDAEEENIDALDGGAIG